MIDIHTGGAWRGSALELATHVRPLFRDFLSQALAKDIKLAICTFSPQVKQISDVLRITFPNYCDSIVIRGRDLSWSYEGNGMKEGKQPYMASAATELQHRHPGEEFSRNTTLLIDDDRENVLLALQHGTRAIWLNPKDHSQLLEDVRELR